MARRAEWTALALAALALAGCGGSGGGAGTRSAGLNLYVTDGFGDSYRQVQITLYKIELSTDGSSFTTVFEDTAGRTLDLRSMSSTAELLASVSVPAGAYTSARITFADTFTLVTPGGGSSSVTVDPSVGTAVGTGHIAVTVATPTKVLESQSATLLLDFKLAQFQLVGGRLRPHIEAGGSGGLSGKECAGHLVGTISNLTATGFDLTGRGGRMIPVVLTDSTVIADGAGASLTLADGQNVLVEGDFDAATGTLTATAVTLRPAADATSPRASGTVASVDSAAGSFVLTVARTDGFQPTGGIIAVTTDSSTAFRKGRHGSGALSDITVGGTVRVGGTFDAATQTLSASIVDLYGGHDGHPH